MKSGGSTLEGQEEKTLINRQMPRSILGHKGRRRLRAGLGDRNVKRFNETIMLESIFKADCGFQASSKVKLYAQIMKIKSG